MSAIKKRINRFTVMAMLQAARANALGLPRPSSYSWGLNRAIFYAAAKRGFRGPGEGRAGEKEGGQGPASRISYLVGDEVGFRDPSTAKLYFTIGGRTQTETDFQQQIGARFGNRKNFSTAWDEVRRIVNQYDLGTLDSRRRFYEEVYKPRRDLLVEAWTRSYTAGSVG